MSEAGNRDAVERLFEALRNGDVEAFHSQFLDDSVLAFPQSGERIVGDARRREVYRSFPGRPTVRRIVTGGDLAVVEASVDYGDGIDWQAVFICELREGKVAALTAYWYKPFAAAGACSASQPVLALHQTPTLTQERYEEVVRQLTNGKFRFESPDDVPFEGLLVHAAGEGKDGFCIFDVFESEEAAARFSEAMGALPRGVGIEVPPEFFPAHTFVSRPSP